MSRELLPSLPSGIYEQLLSTELRKRIEALDDPRLAFIAPVEGGDERGTVAQYLERLLAASLSSVRGQDAADRQRRLAERVVRAVAEELGDDWGERFRLDDPLRRLLAVHLRPPADEGPARPDTPLARSALLTGTRLDPSLASQLRKEIATADRVDVLCSFIKWSGLRLILDELRGLVARPHPEGGPRLRVISTSYMGATDPEAVERLADLPNTQVRVSYDTRRTRLHAKAYIVQRRTGFGSAYIGSANLTGAAISEGLEWTSKISQYELPHLWQKIVGTFETYWNDEEFERFTTEMAGPRLREAIRREAGTGVGVGDLPQFDLRPFPFQSEILDVLAAEREVRNKRRHLVVAATGTGKTMIAAFDYRAWAAVKSPRPTLLFVAHRREILDQALASFRAVLRDQNFGDVLAGGDGPGQPNYLFCSIQSYNSRELWRLPSDHFAYVVVDEFHHAAAPSYKRLLDHVAPGVLLGLTATPERSDDLDVLRYFDGESSCEIRLPDAINRRLLCPFEYFGVADSVDLSGLTWRRGGYDVADLDRIYTGNDVRARLVLDKLQELLLDPRRARGLGFCVSVAHAEFMARFFNDHGLAAVALTGGSGVEERRHAHGRLQRREISFIFTVDLYNEGVDLPEVDTVLFLRPTDSLTVYLQQLGRGLRLHEGKDCLTVLDFIGEHRREFRFAPRLRALGTDPTGRLEREIINGFPHLPAGCSIRLERVAQQRVLANVRQSVNLRRPRMILALRELGRHLGRPPTLRERLDYLNATVEEVFKRGLWSRLLHEAGLVPPVEAPNENRLARGIRRVAHVDDASQLYFWLDVLRRVPEGLDDIGRQRLSMLHVSLWSGDGANLSLEEAHKMLGANPSALADLRAVLDDRLAHAAVRPVPADAALLPLAPHALYTRDEALVALGHWSMQKRPDMREGVVHLPDRKVDAFFVTLHKTEAAYSPTTMYDDYAMGPDLFHLQSQSTTSAQSPTGQRYIDHRQLGYTPLLFVREYKKMPSGLSAPYAYLGPAEYVSHQGSRPISLVWRLRHPMPQRLVRTMARQRVG